MGVFAKPFQRFVVNSSSKECLGIVYVVFDNRLILKVCLQDIAKLGHRVKSLVLLASILGRADFCTVNIFWIYFDNAYSIKGTVSVHSAL